MTAAGATELDFDGWAQLSAKLRIASPTEQTQLLAKANLTASGWAQIHEAWAQRLNEDIAANRMDLPERYAARCFEELQRKQAASETASETAPPPESSPHELEASSPITERRPESPKDPELAPAHSTEGKDSPFPLAQAKPSQPNAGQPGHQQSGDFRNELTPLEDRVSPARPAQRGTMQRIPVATLQRETSRVNEALQWSVQQFARWSANLEQHAHDPEGLARLWQVVGITNTAEQGYVLNQWAMRLNRAPELKREYEQLLAEARAAYASPTA